MAVSCCSVRARQLKSVSMAVFVMLVMPGCGQAPPPDALREGGLFPPLVLKGFDGNEVALDSFRGRVVVLNVWATWCAPCRRELPSLERLNHLIDPQRFVVAGLSVDSDILQAQEYLIDKGITFASYIDPDGKIATDILGIRIYPDTLLISRQGILLRAIAGERVWDNPAVIKALNEAYEGRYELLAGL